MGGFTRAPRSSTSAPTPFAWSSMPAPSARRRPIFNEKVMAGLGAGLKGNGDLSEATMERALAELRRFRLLLDQSPHRERPCRRHRRRPRRAQRRRLRQAHPQDRPALPVLEGARRRRGWPATGCISSIIDADGIVGDLGGGSLELVDVAGGATGAALSMPLGALRAEANSAGERAARKLIGSALKNSGLRAAAGGPAPSIWLAARGAASPRRTWSLPTTRSR